MFRSGVLGGVVEPAGSLSTFVPKFQPQRTHSNYTYYAIPHKIPLSFSFACNVKSPPFKFIEAIAHL